MIIKSVTKDKVLIQLIKHVNHYKVSKNDIILKTSVTTMPIISLELANKVFDECVKMYIKDEE